MIGLYYDIIGISVRMGRIMINKNTRLHLLLFSCFSRDCSLSEGLGSSGVVSEERVVSRGVTGVRGGRPVRGGRGPSGGPPCSPSISIIIIGIRN